ncbi:MAG: DUF4738 domain-containing protein [Bacteroidaceae bacterium]|nr:DUF4738 domain-containing protein [Bacteroidaceae bacterium]
MFSKPFLTSIVRTIVFILAFTALFTSCKEEKKKDIIIVRKEKPQKPKGTQSLETRTDSVDVQWGGSEYTIVAARQADKELPVVKDETTGDKYYDNVIKLTVKRSDGTEAVSKTYRKSDFRQYIDKKLYDSFVLVNITHYDGDDATQKFIVGIGEPDDNSDNFITLQLSLGKTGAVSVKHFEFDEKTGDEADLEP